MISESLRAFLRENGQEHLLAYFSVLTEEQSRSLEESVRQVDFEMLARAKEERPRGEIRPIPYPSAEKRSREKDNNIRAGLHAVQQGRVAAVMLAGGQGTRLGSSAPKGCFDLGRTRHLYLFEAHVQKLVALKERCGVAMPLYIMTSEKNHEQTVAFFEEHSYFGYDKADIGFFRQDSAPCTDMQGRLLMESPWRIATSPNGNGGWYGSLCHSACGDDMRRRGVRWITLFGVDNPLQGFCDAEFIGDALRCGCDCTVKVVPKEYPEELMSVLCLEDGKPSMIAYYEMDDALRHATDADGNLLYGCGDILNTVFSVSALDACMNEALPVHLAKKKVPYADPDGTVHEAKEPNGYKYELFLFDVLPYMPSVNLYLTERVREFAPVKNLTGVDSVDSARELLERNGIQL